MSHRLIIPLSLYSLKAILSIRHICTYNPKFQGIVIASTLMVVPWP